MKELAGSNFDYRNGKINNSSASLFALHSFVQNQLCLYSPVKTLRSSYTSDHTRSISDHAEGNSSRMLTTLLATLFLPLTLGKSRVYSYSSHFLLSLASPPFLPSCTHFWPELTILPRPAVSTVYWPISNPSSSSPWILGQPNYVNWKTGGGTGIDSFDIQLHNANKNVMIGFIPIALRVPMEKLPGGWKNYGGEIEVDLDGDIPTG
jgi:hypothetical protein